MRLHTSVSQFFWWRSLSNSGFVKRHAKDIIWNVNNDRYETSYLEELPWTIILLFLSTTLYNTNPFYSNGNNGTFTARVVVESEAEFQASALHGSDSKHLIIWLLLWYFDVFDSDCGSKIFWSSETRKSLYYYKSIDELSWNDVWWIGGRVQKVWELSPDLRNFCAHTAILAFISNTLIFKWLLMWLRP